MLISHHKILHRALLKVILQKKSVGYALKMKVVSLHLAYVLVP